MLYKARAAGIEVVFVNTAYTSQTCSERGAFWKKGVTSFRVSNVWS
ncbi:MAG: transposase [Deltaproteobacteria bacterium]|nr:transposase [Deltaproteobacteria bacterium]